MIPSTPTTLGHHPVKTKEDTYIQIGTTMNSSSYRYSKGFDSYFTEVNFQKRVFYMLLVCYVASVVLICLAEPFLSPQSCVTAIDSDLNFGNSLFKYNPCRYKRKYYLLFLSPDECSYSRKLVMAVVLGGFIGWERVGSKDVSKSLVIQLSILPIHSFL